MAWLKKVNRHVQVLWRVSASVVKVRSGTITAVGAGELVTVRVGHGGQTFVNIDRRTDPDENQAATKYIAP